MKKSFAWRTVLATFAILFFTCALVVTSLFLLFFSVVDMGEMQIRNAAIYTFLNVVFLAALFTAIDVVRRRIMVERPMREVEKALDRIAAGDLSVRIRIKSENRIFTAIVEHINSMIGELSGLETLRVDFISNVSHEIKTPLAAIQNYGALLQSKDLDEEKRMEYARAVSHSAQKLSDLITNILKLSKLENQQIYPRAQAYALNEQLCECLLQFERVWEEKNIQIETDLQEITLQADAELLFPVWNNLLSNAFKFTEAGGTVIVKMWDEGDLAAVSISDTGCGISPEVGAHMFEKFYQGDTSHAMAGNGLGLPLVKRIIDIVGGEIAVSSTPNVGSTFTVWLPK